MTVNTKLLPYKNIRIVCDRRFSRKSSEHVLPTNNFFQTIHLTVVIGSELRSEQVIGNRHTRSQLENKARSRFTNTSLFLPVGTINDQHFTVYARARISRSDRRISLSAIISEKMSQSRVNECPAFPRTRSALRFGTRHKLSFDSKK